MLCYLLHQSPIWKNLPDGKRNVRIMFMAMTIYIYLHAIAFENKDSSLFFKIIHGYFMWILAVDIFTCACVYKLYYGRSILKELNVHETDYYDEGNHRYHKKNNIVNINNVDITGKPKNEENEICQTDQNNKNDENKQDNIGNIDNIDNIDMNFDIDIDTDTMIDIDIYKERYKKNKKNQKKDETSSGSSKIKKNS